MLEFDPRAYPYPSRRNAVYARRAMACTSIPQVAQIGLEVMKAGGNAVDAAVAMAAAMPLLEPTSNGLGGDCFALVWMEQDKRLYGLNASGAAPAALSAERVRGMGYSQMPRTGWLPVTVPGAPAGWAELNRRFGTRSLTELFAPAVENAREGVPVAVTLETAWESDSRRIQAAMENDPAPHAYWWERFTKHGRPYRAGDVFRWPEMADTLEELAATGCESFYQGPLMEKLVAFSQRTGGYFTREDFQAYSPLWVEPISTDYRGCTVCEMPPNGHGVSVLMALNLLNGLDLPPERESAEAYHKIAEAVKLALTDAKAYVADPRYMKTRVGGHALPGLRRPAALTHRGESYHPGGGGPLLRRDHLPVHRRPVGQYGLLYPEQLHQVRGRDRDSGDGDLPSKPGRQFLPGPGQRKLSGRRQAPLPHHHPRLSSEKWEAVGPFGVMGAFMQPQGHVQVVVNTLDYHMNPQAALDAPRFQWTGGTHIQLEREVSPHIARELARRGHEVEVVNSNLDMGRGQIVWKADNGLYIGGTEPGVTGPLPLGEVLQGFRSAGAGRFAALAASDFLSDEKVTKESPRGRSDGHSVPIFTVPWTPVYGGRQLGGLVRHRKGAGGSADWFPVYYRCRFVVAKSARLRFCLAAKTAPAPLLLLSNANPLRWALRWGPPAVALIN